MNGRLSGFDCGALCACSHTSFLVSQCSATCGLGVRKREFKCMEKTLQGKLMTFPERRCRNIKKPNLELEETCNRRACPVYSMAAGWYSSPWQQVGACNLGSRWSSEMEQRSVVLSRSTVVPCIEFGMVGHHLTYPTLYMSLGRYQSDDHRFLDLEN